MDADFNTALKNLKEAIASNNNTQTYYNNELPKTLQQIYSDLEEIKISIQTLIEENNTEIQRNKGEIDEVTSEKKSIESKLADITSQLNEKTSESEDLKREQAKNAAAFQEKENNLTGKLNELQQKLRENENLSARDKTTLEKKIEETETLIASLRRDFQTENTDLRNEIDDNIQKINIMRTSMEQLSKEKQDATEELNALAGQRITLESSLRQSIELMNEATQRINSFTTSEPPNRQEIQHIKDIISEIKAQLKLSTPGVSRAAELNINGEPVTNKDIVDAFIELAAGDINYWDPIKSEYESSREPQKIIDNLSPNDKTQILNIVNRFKGGRKGRKGRKTRKVKRRKTKKTRKVRKVRKQKGGYHYSERAKRRSITTTSRRSSKRSLSV